MILRKKNIYTLLFNRDEIIYIGFKLEKFFFL